MPYVISMIEAFQLSTFIMKAFQNFCHSVHQEPYIVAPSLDHFIECRSQQLSH